MNQHEIHDLAEQLAPLIAEHATPSLLNAEEAGNLLKVPASWMLAQARAGRVPHVKLGTYTRFDRDVLLEWVDARTVGPQRRASR